MGAHRSCSARNQRRNANKKTKLYSPIITIKTASCNLRRTPETKRRPNETDARRWPGRQPGGAHPLSKHRAPTPKVPPTDQTNWPAQFAIHLRASLKVPTLQAKRANLSGEVHQLRSGPAAKRDELVRRLSPVWPTESANKKNRPRAPTELLVAHL